MMEKLYEFSADVRLGVVDGVFIEDEKIVESSFGLTARFGEILGKHSDVSVKLASEHFEVLTDDAEFIRKWRELGLTSFGYNPLDHVRCPHDCRHNDYGHCYHDDKLLACLAAGFAHREEPEEE